MISIDEKNFLLLTEFLRNNYGINLEKKKNLIEGRLSNHITDLGFDNFDDYLHFVFADKTGGEITNLLNKLTTNHTYFMREWKNLEFYREHILPAVETESRDRDLRVWSAGCSSGEEPYMITMLNQDYFTKIPGRWDTKILATDISQSVLEKAQKGLYDEEALSTVPSIWKMNYFKPAGAGKFQVKDEIRSEVIFRVFNLMEDTFPFKKKFHVIFCRNVMIYFNSATKTRLIQKFYDSLEPGGYLIIGQSESVNREATDFRYVMPSIYCKE